MNPFLRALLLVCALSAALIAAPSQAQSGNHTYAATAPVEGYSEGQRTPAIRAALEQVLIRLTGRSDIADHPAAAQLLADASSYALKFGYVELERGEGQGLNVTFIGSDIDSYLRSHSLPIWPQKRSPVLVWLVKESRDNPIAFVTPEEDEALYQELARLFERRGMPVRYPLFDFEDLLNLTAEEAWKFNAEQIAMASDRYSAEHWLVIRCYETSGGGWRLAWILGGEDRASLKNLAAESLDEGLETVVNTAIDDIAAEYTYIPTHNPSSIAMDVRGIGQYADYKKLMKVIDELPMVKSFAIHRVEAGAMDLDLEIEGDRQLLIDALSLYDQLALDDVSPMDERLTLNWRPGGR